VQLSFSFLNFFFSCFIFSACPHPYNALFPLLAVIPMQKGLVYIWKLGGIIVVVLENTRKHGLKIKLAINYITIECIFCANFNLLLHIHRTMGNNSSSVISHNKFELSSSSLCRDWWLISAIRKLGPKFWLRKKTCLGKTIIQCTFKCV
jgi:hypothetical protein